MPKGVKRANKQKRMTPPATKMSLTLSKIPGPATDVAVNCLQPATAGTWHGTRHSLRCRRDRRIVYDSLVAARASPVRRGPKRNITKPHQLMRLLLRDRCSRCGIESKRRNAHQSTAHGWPDDSSFKCLQCRRITARIISGTLNICTLASPKPRSSFKKKKNTVNNRTKTS